MYKDGAVVQQIFTSFETKRVTISNLPPAITVPDLFKAIEELGEVQNLTIEPAGTDQSVAMADYTTINVPDVKQM